MIYLIYMCVCKGCQHSCWGFSFTGHTSRSSWWTHRSGPSACQRELRQLSFYWEAHQSWSLALLVDPGHGRWYTPVIWKDKDWIQLKIDNRTWRDSSPQPLCVTACLHAFYSQAAVTTQRHTHWATGPLADDLLFSSICFFWVFWASISQRIFYIFMDSYQIRYHIWCLTVSLPSSWFIYIYI